LDAKKEKGLNCTIVSEIAKAIKDHFSSSNLHSSNYGKWRKQLKGHFLHLFLHSSNHLSMKEGSLFCSSEIHRTGMLQIVFLVSLESSRQGGVHGLGSMTFGLAVQKFLKIE
jgi:hypothetical protein